MKKAKTTHVAKVAKPAKSPAPSRQKLQQEVTTLQHEVASLKHHPARRAAKHKTKVSAKHSAKRGWSPDEAVAVCTARAFAESLRLSGRGSVSDSAVLDVYWSTAGDADTGAAILATAVAISGERHWDHFPVLRPLCGPECDCTLILGLALPEPHAVAVGPDGTWWSWGEPWQPPPGVVVEEAWAVTWR